MIWLWRETGGTVRMAEHSAATFCFVLPSLPMFLVIPVLSNRGVDFWPALAFCRMTLVPGLGHTLALRSRSEFSTTEMEDALIAKAANMALIKMPKKGYSTPAAIGTPAVL